MKGLRVYPILEKRSIRHQLWRKELVTRHTHIHTLASNRPIFFAGHITSPDDLNWSLSRYLGFRELIVPRQVDTHLTVPSKLPIRSHPCDSKVIYFMGCDCLGDILSRYGLVRRSIINHEELRKGAGGVLSAKPSFEFCIVRRDSTVAIE